MKSLAYVIFTLFCCISPSVLMAQPASTPLISIPPFSTLAIQGPINVTISTRQMHFSVPTLMLLGDPQTVAAVRWEIKNHTLYLGTKWNYWPKRGDRLTVVLHLLPSQLKQIKFNSNGRLLGIGLTGPLSLTATGAGCIDLYTNKLDLKSLDANGKTNITIHDILSSDLVIEDKSAGKISLQGEVVLNTLDFSSSGNLQIYWVNSSNLKINANGQGQIILAGIAKNLDIHLSKKVHLLAKQLRGATGFVETQNQAHAEVTIKKLNAVAKDNSLVYYSWPINSLSTYTQNAGLILANR